MSFTERFTAKPAVTGINTEEALEDWPRHYYEETDPSARKLMLDAALEQGIDPENDKIREKIFAMRYVPNKNADGGYADMFMRCFMQFSMVTKSAPGPFGLSREKKKAIKSLESMGLGGKGERDELFDSLLLDEFTHLGHLYISLSADSKQYNAVIFGIGHISEEKLIRKLHADLASAGILAAEAFGLRGEMDLWIRGLDRARANLIPQTESLL